MKVTEKQKQKILYGIKTVLSDDKALSEEFIQDKLEKVADVLERESDTDGGKVQEIKPNAFTAGLEDLSEAMSHSDRYQI